MAISNGTSNGVDVKKKDEIDLGSTSTEGDIYKGAGFAGAQLGGLGGVFPIYFYGGGGLGGVGGSSNELLPELPAYWSKSRDAVLSQTMMREPFWAGAVKKTISKGATQQYDFKFKERNRMSAERFRELFKTSNGRQGFKHLLNQGLQDYFLTDNGFFIEIDREDNSKPGSRIIGLYHLDSLRCWRTGDPDVPVIYSDLHGQFHFLAWWQVWSIADTPNARNNYFGVGFCAASSVYERIRRMVAIRLFQYQRMTAHTPYAMTVVGGISATQLEDWRATNQASQLAKGNTVFGGHMIIPIMARDPVSTQTIELTKMPENYNEPEEIEQAAIEYSLSLGVAKTDLKPLTGRMAGTATQTEVIDSQSDSSGLGLFSGEFEDFVNDRVLPSTITYFWAFNKTNTKKAEAEVASAYIDGAASLVQVGLPSDKAINWLVDKDVLDAEYLQGNDATQTQILAEDDKPDVVDPDPALGQTSPATQSAQAISANTQAQVQDVVNQLAGGA